MDEEGKRIEILLGALAMQEWGIRLLPDEERLDMSHYPKEFIEFIIAEQAEQTMAHYEQTASERHAWQAGDFVEY